MLHPRPVLGVGMISLAALCFAINGTVSKVILQSGIRVPDLATFRALGACLGLLLAGALIRPGITRFRITLRELPTLAIFGITGFFAVPMLYFVSISRMPVGIALLFEFTAPLFIALWARFVQHQRVRARLWLGLALSLIGLACVAEVWGDLTLDGIGILAGFSAAILLAIYFLMGSSKVARRDPISLTGWAFGVSALAGFLTRALTGWWTADGAVPDWSALTGTTAAGTPLWLLAVYLVVLGTIVPYSLIVTSLRHLPATSVGIISMIEPVLAAAIAWTVLGEALNPAQLMGGAILLLGVGLAETARVAVGQNGPHVSSEGDPGHPVTSEGTSEGTSGVAPQRDGSPATA